jgi:DNA-binding transcriptional LysR family regulator
MRVNNGTVMRDAAMAELGLALLPMFLVDGALEAGELSYRACSGHAEWPCRRLSRKDFNSDR